MTQFPDLSALPPDQAIAGLMHTLFTPREGAPKPFEEALAPADESHVLPACGAVHRWGVNASGGRVLVCHGWEGRASQFAPIIEGLLARGIGVDALDAPGHGLAKGQKSNPLEFSRAVSAAGAQFGPYGAIAGHSQGAMAVLHSTAEHGAGVNAIGLIAPVVSVETFLRLACQLVKLNPDTTEAFIQTVDETVGVPPSVFEADRLATRINAKALIVHDRQDRELPFEKAEALAHGWPQASFMATDGLGHRRILFDGTVAAQMVDFLAEHASLA